MSEGEPRTETAEPGEVIWRAGAGVTYRRWNWRQGPRTRLTTDTTDMWFVLERLTPMPAEALIEAGQAIEQGVTQTKGRQLALPPPGSPSPKRSGEGQGVLSEATGTAASRCRGGLAPDRTSAMPAMPSSVSCGTSPAATIKANICGRSLSPVDVPTMLKVTAAAPTFA